MPAATDLLALLEYRMRAVAIGHLALRYATAWDKPPSLKVYFEELQVMEGSATGFTNGAIESGIMHCRALLEFLGLGAGKTATTLRELTEVRRPDDHGIEQIVGLTKVSIAEAIASYPGPGTEAEGSLAYVVYLANKGLAHTSKSFTKHDQGARLLEIAFRGVPILIANKVHIRLGIEPPPYQVPGRDRVA
jgi:hypothetical protein